MNKYHYDGADSLVSLVERPMLEHRTEITEEGKMNSKADAIAGLKTLSGFISKSQLSTLNSAMRGEEKQFFFDKMVEMATLVSIMPKTYEQEAKGNQAVAYLHYFRGNQDWYITEKDMESPDEPGQHQAFGWADLGYGGELGYISIVEIIAANVELDLYWKPTTLEKIRAKQLA